MSLIDKQIMSVLDQVHDQMLGRRAGPCRWQYLSKTDQYHCSCDNDTRIWRNGNEVIPLINNSFSPPR